MKLVATLPWYDLPATGPALDALWQNIRQQLRLTATDGCKLLPTGLTRNTDLTELWQNPGLLLSQCCGPDLFTQQAMALIPVARPVFSMLDCAPGDYYSHIVTGTGSLPEHPRLVINGLTSRSGCFALLEWLEQQSIKPASIEVSGSHQESLQWLKQNRADLAAIDAQSWNFLRTESLYIIGRSRPAPAPPRLSCTKTAQCLKKHYIQHWSKRYCLMGIIWGWVAYYLLIENSTTLPTCLKAQGTPFPAGKAKLFLSETAFLERQRALFESGLR